MKAFLRYTQGSESEKKLLERGWKWSITRDQIKGFASQHRGGPRNTAPFCPFHLFLIKSRHGPNKFQPFAECGRVISLSLNAHHQFANEPIKQRGMRSAVVRTTPARDIPIAASLLLILAQMGFLRPGSVAPFGDSIQPTGS